MKSRIQLKRQEKKEKNKQWNIVRQEVKDLQNNKCYMCNAEIYGMSAHIHHIADRRFKELFLEKQNLILLCPRCHKFDKLSVHNTSIYFSEMLRKKEPERYYYLLKMIDVLNKK